MRGGGWAACVVGGVAEGGGHRKVVVVEGGGLMNAGEGTRGAGRRTLSLSQVHDRLENAKLAVRKSERERSWVSRTRVEEREEERGRGGREKER